MLKILPLTGKDAKRYHAFCEGARKRPGFFYEPSVDEPLEARLSGLAGDANCLILGVIGTSGELIGVASISRKTHPRCRHRASLYQIHAALDSKNALAALLDAAITLAEGLDGLRQLGVAVDMDDFRLLEVALRTGFEHYGILPDAVQLDGCFYDQWLMIRRLTGPKAGERE